MFYKRYGILFELGIKLHLRLFPIAENPRKFSLTTNVVSDNYYRDEDESNNNLLAELSDSIKKFNFPTVISVNEYLSFPEENVTFELPESDNIISLFSREEVDDDDSNEAPIISASMALKSLETVRTDLTQQEDTSSYLRLVKVWRISFMEKR